ncbi:hypothetical protein HPB47_007942, partial [Ixodes persulcatus]
MCPRGLESTGHETAFSIISGGWDWWSGKWIVLQVKPLATDTVAIWESAVCPVDTQPGFKAFSVHREGYVWTNDSAWALARDQSELARVPPTRKICAKHCDFTIYCDCTAYDSLGVLQLFALELPESRIVFLLIIALQ